MRDGAHINDRCCEEQHRHGYKPNADANCYMSFPNPTPGACTAKHTGAYCNRHKQDSNNPCDGMKSEEVSFHLVSPSQDQDAIDVKGEAYTPHRTSYTEELEHSSRSDAPEGWAAVVIARAPIRTTISKQKGCRVEEVNRSQCCNHFVRELV
jgi:hypothetical protein